jgi:hypothetical protein
MVRPQLVAACVALTFLCAAPACACSGASAEQPAPAAPDTTVDPIQLPNLDARKKAEPAPPPAPPPAAIPLPTACAERKNGKLCLPDDGFVERLCKGSWPDVSLIFFHKDSPWTRGYVARQVSAWNASGGGMSTSAKLTVDEELILLRYRGNAGGMVVSGAAGGYDALRWDGTCISLQGDEVRMHPQGIPKHAPIPWRKLEEKTQTTLLADTRIHQNFDKRRKDCQGETTGTGPTPCERAEAALSSMIVLYVRSGGAVPPPATLP